MLVFGHDDAAGHATPPGHPEQVARIAAVEAGLQGIEAERREALLGDWSDVLRAHDEAHVERVTAAGRQAAQAGLVALDADTFVSPGSVDAALRAVGGICVAVDAVLAGEARTAFNIARPPGHHAERSRAMGFCLFGTVAIGALRALDHHSLSRVAIVDFDVHHGNGTQDILWDEARCLFASTHQMPLYPGSGAASERGAHGQVLNVPLAPGTGAREMRAAYDRLVFPALEAWAPELILISAGFDAHADDPLGGLEWEAADYAWLTGRLCDMGSGRVVSTLEGGYDLAALSASVAAHAGVLAERG